MNPVGSFLINGIKKKAAKTILDPLNEIVDQNLMDITTTIGSFIVRKVRGQFQRSITFTIGNNYTDRWMEAALYGIIYKYNNLKKTSRLEIGNDITGSNGSGMYFRLDDGTHNLKYRKWNILLCIQTPNSNASIPTRQGYRRVYTIITYDMSPEFTEAFEKDMLDNRNSLLKIRSDRTSIAIYNDGHENDGYTYWDKLYDIPRRKLNTIYLPYEQKKLLVDTINAWHANKKWYNDHGIPHNLTILLYGPPGSGKTSITKMIASEWNRNIYECTGGKDGKFIPQCITNYGEDSNKPLYSISDIDKYPFLIDEQNISMDGEKDNEKANSEQMQYKQLFGAMINALDGITSGEDRLIVMTTNNIDKFSEVLLRPGRVHLKMEIGYVVPEVFRKFVFDYYGKELPKDIELSRDDITISELQSAFIYNKMTFDEFIKTYMK